LLTGSRCSDIFTFS